MTIISKTLFKALVKYNGKFYIVSDNGMETLIFPSNREGEVTHWVEVGGGRGYTLDEVIEDFTNMLHKF